MYRDNLLGRVHCRAHTASGRLSPPPSCLVDKRSHRSYRPPRNWLQGARQQHKKEHCDTGVLISGRLVKVFPTLHGKYPDNMLRIQTHEQAQATHWDTGRHRWIRTGTWHEGWCPFETSACCRSKSADTGARRLQSR